MTSRTLKALVDEAQEWGPLEWWRLELRSFVGAPRAQHTLVVLAPKEAVRGEHPGLSFGSVVQSLAYLFLLIAPLIGAAAMLRWLVAGSVYDFPLALAGILTLISLPITGWSELQRRRHPRAAAKSAVRSNSLMHVLPGLASVIIALTAGRDLLAGGAWAWIVVILADVVIYAAMFVRGNTIKDGPQNPHDNVDQSVKEIPADQLRGIIADRDAAIDLLVERGLIGAATGDDARATAPGHLALTLAPEAGSAYYRPDQV
jgi:hypothetical protein